MVGEMLLLIKLQLMLLRVESSVDCYVFLGKYSAFRFFAARVKVLSKAVNEIKMRCRRGTELFYILFPFFLLPWIIGN